MLRVLVYVEVDLPSSMALRYLYQLANWLPMKIDIISVKASASEGPSTGSGWARRTWERELIEKAREELSQFVSSEGGNFSTIGTTKVLFGPREETILKEILQERHDLFEEGVSPFSSAEISLFKRIRSRLYQRLPCPVLLVQKLMPINRVLILSYDLEDLETVLQGFTSLFNLAKPKVDLLFLGPPEIHREGEEIARSLLEVGISAYSLEEQRDRLKAFLETYGLLVGAFEREVRGQHPALEVMGTGSSGILLFLCREKTL